jgi:hypothetical protein
MSLHAIDDIGDAIDATKAFLTPVSLGQWLKLAFVVLFVGGGGGGGFNQVRSLSNANRGSTGPDSGFELVGPLRDVLDVALGQTTLPPEARTLFAGVGLLVLVAIAGVVLLSLLVGLLSNFMEFVFVQSLIEEEVHIRRYFGGNIGNGLRLLGFRLAVKVVSLLVTVAMLWVVFVAVLGVNLGNLSAIDEAVVFDAITLLIVPLFLASMVTGLVTGFTNNFVVPLMLQGDRGVLAGWGRLWSSITDQPKQYVAYVFFSVVLGIGVSLVVTMLGLFLFLILLIPFGLVALVCLTALGQSVVTFAVITLLGAVFFLVVIAFGLLARVPLQSFLRYYSMLVLGDIDESLDPIPAVRSTIRDEGSTPGEAA